MIEQIIHTDEIPWTDLKVGITKELVGKSILNSSSMRLFCLRSKEKFASHDHNFVQIMYFLTGEGSVFLDDVETRVQPGLIVVVKPNQCHAIENYGDKSMDVIVIESYEPLHHQSQWIDF
jgi:mannose-6-phosphate isomerase-like protein (cupin superfamily)